MTVTVAAAVHRAHTSNTVWCSHSLVRPVTCDTAFDEVTHNFFFSHRTAYSDGQNVKKGANKNLSLSSNWKISKRESSDIYWTFIDFGTSKVPAALSKFICFRCVV